MDIGRKVYYELSTGNVILDTGERSGDVVETTEAQDFALYATLAQYQQGAVGILQLTFGQDTAYFGKYPYHVDITQTPPVLAWDTSNPIGATLADVQASKKTQLEDMYQQTLAAGFQVSISTGTFVFGWRSADITNMTALQMAINQTWQTFPVQYADVNGNPVTISSQSDLNAIEQTAQKFMTAQHQQVLTLIGQVQATTSTTDVQTIQWSAAPY